MPTDETPIEIIIKNIFKNIQAYTTHVNLNFIDNILLNENYQYEPQRFLYTLLYKLNNGLSSCDYFIINFNNAERHLESLFLILRTLLSDSIMCHYVIQHGDKTDSQVVNNIMSLYFDHFEYAMNNMKKYGGNFGNFKQDFIDNEINTLKKAHEDFFNEDGSNKFKTLPAKNIPSAINYLLSNNEKGMRPMLVRTYDLYDQFSKLEHLGYLSFQLMHRQYDVKRKALLLLDIIDATIFIVYTMRICLLGWPELDTEKDEIYNVLSIAFKTDREQIKKYINTNNF